MNSVSSDRLHYVFREDMFLFAFCQLNVARESVMGIEESLKNTVKEKIFGQLFKVEITMGESATAGISLGFFLTSHCTCSLEVEPERKCGRKFFV